VDPDPDPGARKLRNFSGKMHFLVTYLKKKNYFLKKNLMNITGIFDLIQILISKKFEKKIFFKNSVLAWIRNPEPDPELDPECWIRIRSESIRIHNPDHNYG
jgi:hypothetical protein